MIVCVEDRPVDQFHDRSALDGLVGGGDDVSFLVERHRRLVPAHTLQSRIAGQLDPGVVQLQIRDVVQIVGRTGDERGIPRTARSEIARQNQIHSVEVQRVGGRIGHLDRDRLFERVAEHIAPINRRDRRVHVTERVESEAVVGSVILNRSAVGQAGPVAVDQQGRSRGFYRFEYVRSCCFIINRSGHGIQNRNRIHFPISRRRDRRTFGNLYECYIFQRSAGNSVFSGKRDPSIGNVGGDLENLIGVTGSIQRDAVQIQINGVGVVHTDCTGIAA